VTQEVQKYDPVFLEAVARVLADEGGYVNHPDDPGGETKFGISKRAYPDEDIQGMTPERATAIYWDRWMEGCFYRLKGDVASKVFNLSVVMGEKHAVTCLQRALRACMRSAPSEDGELGIATANYANNFQNVPALLAAIRSEAAGYFRTTDAIAHQTHGGNHPFLKGWLNRAYS